MDSVIWEEKSSEIGNSFLLEGADGCRRWGFTVWVLHGWLKKINHESFGSSLWLSTSRDSSWGPPKARVSFKAEKSIAQRNSLKSRELRPQACVRQANRKSPKKQNPKPGIADSSSCWAGIFVLCLCQSWLLLKMFQAKLSFFLVLICKGSLITVAEVVVGEFICTLLLCKCSSGETASNFK